MAPPGERNDGGGTLRRLFESLIAVAGGLLILAAAGVLVDQIARGDGSPPAIAIEVANVQSIGGGIHLVEFVARNHGGSTAAKVAVEGTLSSGSFVLEQNRVTLDYVASRSSQRGGFYFSHDPRMHDLRLRAVGYVRP